MSAFKTSLLVLALSTAPAWAQAPADGDVQVKAQKNGDLVTVDASVEIAGTPQEVWDVLVDFDHMAGFLHGLDSSKVAAKDGDVWRVEQKGHSSHAGFTLKFESVREVRLHPIDSLQSHLVSGTLKKHDTLTQLSPDGAGTRVSYHAESIAGVWVPPLLGTSVVEGEVRQQFQDVQAEVLKRKASH
jgi:carbon monoxide dehydrogenase subunit G